MNKFVLKKKTEAHWSDDMMKQNILNYVLTIIQGNHMWLISPH